MGAMMTMTMAMTQISFEEFGIHAVAEASTREHPREATIIEQARIMPKCASIAPWQVRCIQGHIAANLQTGIRIADLAGIVRCSSYRIKRVFKTLRLHAAPIPHTPARRACSTPSVDVR
jgi:hypothetical protein